MTDTSYSWFYEEPFHAKFVAFTTSLSIVSNCFLIFIMFTTNSASIGHYRYLLAVFAISDMTSSAGHSTLYPYCHMTTTGFYFFPRNGKMMIAGRSYDTAFALTFIATYYQTFLVLAFHYVYRFKILASATTRSFTDNWTKKQWILLGVVVYILYIGTFVTTCAIFFTPTQETRDLVPQEIFDTYGIDLRHPDCGFTVIAMRRPCPEMQWHGPSVVGFLTVLGMFGGTAIVIFYCIWRTVRNIRSSDFNLTTSTRKLQMNIFKALLVQTAIPVIFSYAPLSMILLFGPLTGISLGAFGNVFLSTTSIFPSVDAFFVLYFITPYRIAVIRLFRLPFTTHSTVKVEQQTNTGSMTTNVTVS